VKSFSVKITWGKPCKVSEHTIQAANKEEAWMWGAKQARALGVPCKLNPDGYTCSNELDDCVIQVLDLQDFPVSSS
jgi:hypothetical protein